MSSAVAPHRLRALDGARRRGRVAAIATVGLLGLSATVLAALALSGHLGDVQWSDDGVTAVTTSTVCWAAIVCGFVVARWPAPVAVWLAAVAAVLLEQARWVDDPNFDGMDDLAPSFMLPFTPLSMLLPALGLIVARVLRRLHPA